MSESLPLTERDPDPAAALDSEPPSERAAPSAVRRDLELPSLRQLFDEYAPFVWRTLRHFGVRDADVEDVCQEVFVAVHRKLEGFEGRSSIKTWLYGICLRTASDHRRRAYVRRERAVSEPPPVAIEPEQLAGLELAQRRQILARLLDELDEDKRAVFVLYELEELTMKEVAEVVGCPLQTAYSRLHAARKRVLEAAAEQGLGGRS